MIGRVKAIAYIGVGSNLDDPQHQVIQAMNAVDQSRQCTVIARSSLYGSEPVGFSDQPDFVNAVCKISTTLAPLPLLKHLLKLEKAIGRIRVSLPNRPRRIDLDLLLYGSEQLETAELTLPHPRIRERRFVLEPLVEISRDLEIPGKGNALDFLEMCMNQQVNKLNCE